VFINVTIYGLPVLPGTGW